MVYLELSKMKRKKKKFIRQDATSYKRLKKKWRRPRGTQSKQRKKQKGRGRIPSSGYGSPRKTRGLHPSGFKEVLVFNLNDLINLDPSVHVCRIGSSVGRKKRFEIMKKANESQLKILNPTKTSEQKKTGN